MESPKVEANRIIKEFEKMAKDAATGPTVTTKTSRLIEKFEKKSQGVEEVKGGAGANISSIKKVFEPDMGGKEQDPEKAADVIAAGATNKLIGRFQESTPATDC